MGIAVGFRVRAEPLGLTITIRRIARPPLLGDARRYPGTGKLGKTAAHSMLMGIIKTPYMRQASMAGKDTNGIRMVLPGARCQAGEGEPTRVSVPVDADGKPPVPDQRGGAASTDQRGETLSPAGSVLRLVETGNESGLHPFVGIAVLRWQPVLKLLIRLIG